MAFDSIKKALFPQGDDTESIEDESYDVDSKSISKAGSKMVLVEPRAYSESQTIADHLKGRNSVVVNLKRVTNDQAKRIIDFLSGTLYAIGGDMQKLGNGIYLCTPKNVNVEGRMSDAEEDKKAKAKIEDELDF
jgi:cell division inhibitor SepF